MITSDGWADNWNTFTILTLTFSIISFVFGASKYFAIGHMRVILHNAPAGGLATGRFIMLMIINMMFALRVWRVFHITGPRSVKSYLSTDVNLYLASESAQSYFGTHIGMEFLFMLLPTIPSIFVNIFRLMYTSPCKSWIRLMVDQPQVFIAPAFCPFLFQGKKYYENGQVVRTFQIWKFGSYCNVIYIGVIPYFVTFSFILFEEVSNVVWVVLPAILALPSLIILTTFFYSNCIFSRCGCHCTIKTVDICPTPNPYMVIEKYQLDSEDIENVSLQEIDQNVESTAVETQAQEIITSEETKGLIWYMYCGNTKIGCCKGEPNNEQTVLEASSKDEIFNTDNIEV